MRALATSTKRSYLCHLRSYLEFCRETGLPPTPATSSTICRYAVYLARRLSYVSVPKYLNILRILHLEAGLENPLQNNWFLDTVLKGMRRDKGSTVHRKLPITPQLLLRFHSRLNLNDQKDVLFWAACLVAFFGLFRKSSLIPSSPRQFDPAKQLTRGDVQKAPQGLAVRVKWTKTLQFRERLFYVPLPLIPNHPLCPASAVLTLLAFSGPIKPDMPLFSIGAPPNLSMLTQNVFVSQLRSLVTELGLPAKEYASHSFRRGGASWAFEANLPGEVIQILGDWRSDAYKDYLEIDLTQKFKFMQQFASKLPAST